MDSGIMRLKRFLDKYDTVIFDMDGVITSEQNYWNCAALTVWEYLNLEEGIGVHPELYVKNEDIDNVRKRVFFNDLIIRELKNKGVNSNWDLGYVTVLITWICEGIDGWSDFSSTLTYAKEKLGDNIIDEYDRLAKECSEKTGIEYERLIRGGSVWKEMCDIFQQWFLGDKLFEEWFGYKPRFEGKTGLIYNEEPLINKQKLVDILRLLSADKRVCTGTGRPRVEMIRPLDMWDIKKYFAPDGLCNYDHVVAAEKVLNNNALTKPHPYMFLKALYGTDYDDKKLISGDYDKDKIKTTLVVGDAGADILAAKAMGVDFCAVLTGIQGEAARPYFEDMGAEYILNSVEDFLEEN